MTTTPDTLTTAEQAPGIMASHGDECAAALITEIERLRAIEAAARALCAAEAAYAGVGEGTYLEPELVLIGRIHETQAALRIALANGGAK